MIKILILTNNDIPWDLPLWFDTIKALRDDFDLSSGIYVFPDKIDKAGEGIQVPLWYFKTYGIKNFILLSLFAIVRYSKFVLKTGIYDFDSLGKHFNIPVFHFKTPNSKEFISKIKKNSPDIGLILLTHILKKKVLDISGIDFINVHGGCLPKCGGVMPYLYSIIHNIKPQLTFYKVDRKINSGSMIKSFRYKNKKASMVKYYKDLFNIYPKVISNVIQVFLKEKSTLKKIDKSRLFSYPTKKEFQKFMKRGYKIIEFRDIYLSK